MFWQPTLEPGGIQGHPGLQDKTRANQTIYNHFPIIIVHMCVCSIYVPKYKDL